VGSGKNKASIPRRIATRPRRHHAGGYAAFNELLAGGGIVEAGWWTHVRRKFFDVHAATGYPSPKKRSIALVNSMRSRKSSTDCRPDTRTAQKPR